MIRPISLKVPVKPRYIMPDDDAEFNNHSYSAYKARLEIYKTDLAEYEHQEKAFGDIIAFIQDTVTAQNVNFIQQEEDRK